MHRPSAIGENTANLYEEGEGFEVRSADDILSRTSCLAANTRVIGGLINDVSATKLMVISPVGAIVAFPFNPGVFSELIVHEPNIVIVK